MTERILSENVSSLVEQTVVVSGWVHARRDHGGLIFIDLRDHTGLVQLVINPESQQAFSVAEELRDEFVVKATGLVSRRGEGLANPNIASGDVEVVVESLEILNRAETLPIQPFSEHQANEELRLKYRYLDL
ncbi:aspartate--tRNA ligase, partial [Candidatus Saccharibacteria bacterium 32-49-12]